MVSASHGSSIVDDSMIGLRHHEAGVVSAGSWTTKRWFGGAVTLTESETKALLASCILVLLAAFGRVILQPGPAAIGAAGLQAAVSVDSALARAEAVQAEADRRKQPLVSGEKIDPNTASEVELDRLPGVGPALARAIASAREDDGPFQSLADLERVPGLGSKTVKRLAPYVALMQPAGAAGQGSGGPRRTRPEGVQRRKLDVNRASALELQALPGIGPARAEAIVRWREEHGAIRSLADLLEIRGIGPATLERLKPLVAVGP